ncbi:MAG: metal ABC transporter permease, partial [Pseudomonadota bacterium]
AARLLLMLALALIVAVAMQVVGLLLVTAMLILPAAAARPLAVTPERMAVAASLLGALGALLGLEASVAFDTPSGPTIVVALFGQFCLLNLVAALRRTPAR